ncbi:hypothetical protein M5K25_020627 [Dendrobium thyrsiflorum]|uniref:Uncharacterized protein n=1 Tax=Dendrobium thyrsiflorum TaxID=117978 RepID=A0ABD0UHR7_DENTH
MGETQSKSSSGRIEDVDMYLYMFLRLKPKITVEPKIVEDWVMRLEKTFDGMQYPPEKRPIHDMNDMHSASQSALIVSTAPIVSYDTLLQFTGLVPQLMGDAQNRGCSGRTKDVNRYLQIFLKLKPLRFEGTIEPKIVED